MKAAPFGYARPATVDDVVAELSGGDAKVLAGGQSLVPVLAMRLARPATLVDINRVGGLDAIDESEDGLAVGATVRQRAVQEDPRTRSVPLLGMALPWVGHRELRSRGTVCGSLAHADPAAELPAVARCLDATVEVVGADGAREIPAADFFAGPMSTTARSDEFIVKVTFPVAAPGQGFGFAELARRHGDFALAGAAVRVDLVDGREPTARLVAFGVSGAPVVADAGAWLTDAGGRNGDIDEVQRRLDETAADFVAGLVDTEGDAHGSPAYRRRVLAVLAARETARALGRAREDDR